MAATVTDFRNAKIKVWMLTGDKGETAHNIGISCGLVDPINHISHKISSLVVGELKEQMSFILKAADSNETSENKINELMKPQQDFSILVDGTSLALIFEHEDLSKQLNEVFKIAASVIVFRCSPDEKAQVIKFVMDNDKDAFCCAIGDGANDINMIQSAHIGVGIEGNEGNLAAFFADYSIPEFKALRRLILWHGREFAKRAYEVFVPLAIFKGTLFMGAMLYANLDNGISGLNNFEAFYFVLQNILNTNIDQVAFQLMAVDVEYEETVKPAKKVNFRKSSLLNHSKLKLGESVRNLFHSERRVAELGHEYNADGSTNNLC